VIGFMTWMWLSIIVILVGAKLNAEMEHQTARESTVGTQTAWSPRREDGRRPAR
jgi:membrane protein